eukprot:s203_g34.t1
MARSQCVSFLAMSGVAEILCLKAPDDEDDRHIRVRHGHDLSHRSHGSEMSCAPHFVAPAEKAADYTEIGDGLVAQAGRNKSEKGYTTQ